MRKLPSAKKVWTMFTNKLQSKLHRINTSKAIKKPPAARGRPNRTCRKQVSWPTFSLQSKQRKQKLYFNIAQKLRFKSSNRLTSLSCINQLFLEPVTAGDEQVQPFLVEERADRERCMELSSPCRNEREFVDQLQDSMPKTSMEDWSENEIMEHTADDMWESLVVASPEMHGIDERAEEFIARFRAEMQQQEKTAHYERIS